MNEFKVFQSTGLGVKYKALIKYGKMEMTIEKEIMFAKVYFNIYFFYFKGN